MKRHSDLQTRNTQMVFMLEATITANPVNGGKPDDHTGLNWPHEGFLGTKTFPFITLVVCVCL